MLHPRSSWWSASVFEDASTARLTARESVKRMRPLYTTGSAGERPQLLPFVTPALSMRTTLSRRLHQVPALVVLFSRTLVKTARGESPREV